MNAPVQADAVEIEALLRAFSDSLAARQARRQLRQGWFAFSSRTVALLLSFIVAPGGATAAIFLMTDQIGLQAQADDADAILAKSDRLQPRLRPAEISRDYRPDVRPQPVEAFDASDLFVSNAIRGRIEDAMIETAAASPQTAPTVDGVAHKQKTRRPVGPIKPPALPAESAALDARPPSLLGKLFGSSSL
jgi:hypothetical protein